MLIVFHTSSHPISLLDYRACTQIINICPCFTDAGAFCVVIESETIDMPMCIELREISVGIETKKQLYKMNFY